MSILTQKQGVFNDTVRSELFSKLEFWSSWPPAGSWDKIGFSSL